MSVDLLLTVKDVQQATQAGRMTVYGLIRDRELPMVCIGRTIRVRRESLGQRVAEQDQPFCPRVGSPAVSLGNRADR